MNKKNFKVLVVATSRKTRGGITAVVKAHEQGEHWKRFNCKWIETHIDKTNFVKFLYFANAFLKFIFLLPFYSIVHIHFSWPQSVRRKFLFFATAKILGKKVIAHLHSGAEPIMYTQASSLYRYIFKNADMSVFLADVIKNKLSTEYIISNSATIFNPCLLPPSKELSKCENIILFAGSITKKKGVEDLIKAFASVAKKTKSWKLILAGNGEIPYFQRLAQELNIENTVEFPGWISGKKKIELFSRASVFCLPSYTEGFPMAVLDAWSYGLPVICTPVGGLPDIVQDGENALVFNFGDVDMLARQLEKIIFDKQLRAHIGAKSRHLAETTFNIESINSQISDLYEKITNAPIK